MKRNFMVVFAVFLVYIRTTRTHMSLSRLESNKPSKVYIQLNTQKTSEGSPQYEYFFSLFSFFSSLSLLTYLQFHRLFLYVFFFDYDIDRKIEAKQVWQQRRASSWIDNP